MEFQQYDVSAADRVAVKRAYSVEAGLNQDQFVAYQAVELLEPHSAGGASTSHRYCREVVQLVPLLIWHAPSDKIVPRSYIFVPLNQANAWEAAGLD